MEYIFHLLVLAAIYGILALSLNLLAGYTGLMSLMHAVFFGIGAYGTALLTIHDLLPFLPALIGTLVLTAGLSAIAGTVLNKFKDDYYALVSLGINIIFVSLLLNRETFTHGVFGIAGIPRPFTLFETQYGLFPFLALSLMSTGLLALFSFHLGVSPFGRMLRAVKDDVVVCAALGYNVARIKRAIFTVSACMAAWAGGLFAVYLRFIDPRMFSVQESVFILTITIAGGFMNLRGSLTSALLFTLVPELLRFLHFPSSSLADIRQIIYGLVLMLFTLFNPKEKQLIAFSRHISRG